MQKLKVWTAGAKSRKVRGGPSKNLGQSAISFELTRTAGQSVIVGGLLSKCDAC